MKKMEYLDGAESGEDFRQAFEKFHSIQRLLGYPLFRIPVGTPLQREIACEIRT